MVDDDDDDPETFSGMCGRETPAAGGAAVPASAPSVSTGGESLIPVSVMLGVDDAPWERRRSLSTSFANPQDADGDVEDTVHAMEQRPPYR